MLQLCSNWYCTNSESKFSDNILIIHFYIPFPKYKFIFYLQLDPRIINGEIDNLNRFPWHVSIVVGYANKPINYCGGSIITETFVLTSADCIIGAKTITLNMGSVSFSKPALTIQTTTFYTHPQYSTSTFQANLGLIRLATPLVFTPTISAIRLVSRSQEQADFFTYSEAYLSGFGITSNSKYYR